MDEVAEIDVYVNCQISMGTVCDLMTSLWYFPHKVARIKQWQYHSFCQTMVKVWDLEGGRGLYVEITVQFVRVVLYFTKKELLALTR